MEYLSDYVTRALQLAISAHAGQKDKAGKPYINHPTTVAIILAKNGYSDMHIATALLHDVVEDTDYSLDDLRRLDFPKEIVEALRVLTHEDSVSYLSYIEEIKANHIAKPVKIADLLHNSDESRIEAPSRHDRERWSKYHEALNILRQ